MKAKAFSRRKRFVHKSADSRVGLSGFADLREGPFGIAVPFRFFIAEGSDDLQPCEFSRGGSCPDSGSLTDSMPSTREVLGFQYTSK
jgi:hypothetical protein